MSTTATTTTTTPTLPMLPTIPLTPPSMSPTASPPRTPVDYKPRTSNTTPNSDDSSVIDDLSFDYVFDHEGNYVRLSKGSSSKSNHSSPPTPDNFPLQHPDPPKLSPPQRRSSLSRSESAHAALNVAPSDPARSFQRVTSGPALASHKARPFPRRVTLEDKPRPVSASGPPRPSRTADPSSYPHEKENILSVDSDNHVHLHGHASKSTAAGAAARVGYPRPLLADSHQRQILPGPNRAGRIMKSIGFGLGLNKAIPESYSTGIDDLPSDYDTDAGKFAFHLSFTLLTFVQGRTSSQPRH